MDETASVCSVQGVDVPPNEVTNAQLRIRGELVAPLLCNTFLMLFLLERFRLIKSSVFSDKVIDVVYSHILQCRSNYLRSYYPPTRHESTFEDTLERFMRRIVCGHGPHTGLLLHLRSSTGMLEEAHLCTDCTQTIVGQQRDLRPGCCETEIQSLKDVKAYEFIGAVNMLYSIYYYRYALFF